MAGTGNRGAAGLIEPESLLARSFIPPVFLWATAGAIGLAAFLLFLVQPMLGRMLLPLAGGSPSVWNCCLLFAQTALLVGYAYAHGLTGYCPVWWQPAIHVGLGCLAWWSLPFGFGGHREGLDQIGAMPLFGILWREAGLAFAYVAASAPLLQSWFARTTHPAARDPYFLYAASNAGSLIGLLAYPMLLEPTLGLSDQARVWAWGSGGLVLWAGVLGFWHWHWLDPGAGLSAEGCAQSEGPTTEIKAAWIVLAALSTGLVMGVTQYLTADVVAMPLLWVVPLSLYLISYMVAFAWPGRADGALTEAVCRYALLPVLATQLLPMCDLQWWAVGLQVAGFFLLALRCHGRLARLRPPRAWLTRYYLALAVGGAAGGIGMTFLPMQLFSSLIEYPLLVLLTWYALAYGPMGYHAAGSAAKSGPEAGKEIPSVGGGPSHDVGLRWGDWWAPLGFGGLVGMACVFLRGLSFPAWVDGLLLWSGVPLSEVPWSTLRSFVGIRKGELMLVGMVVIMSLATWMTRRYLGERWDGHVAVGVCAVVALFEPGRQAAPILHQSRNFFGALEVRVFSGSLPGLYLTHGVTQHGMQPSNPKEQQIPQLYYHPLGALGDIFSSPALPASNRSIGVVGLGVGAMAAYSSGARELVFYEIDPDVVFLARDAGFFHYLQNSRAPVRIELGDARLRLREAPDASFDLLVLDAFLSDTVPVHLLTLEAIDLYLRKLRPTGVLVIHASAKYLWLTPVLRATATRRGLDCLLGMNLPVAPGQACPPGLRDGLFVVLGRTPAIKEDLCRRAGFRWKVARPGQPEDLWTDERAPLWPYFRFGPMADTAGEASGT